MIKKLFQMLNLTLEASTSLFINFIDYSTILLYPSNKKKCCSKVFLDIA